MNLIDIPLYMLAFILGQFIWDLIKVQQINLTLLRNFMYVAIAGLVVYSLYTAIYNLEQRVQWLEVNTQYLIQEVELLKDKNEL